MQLWIMTCVFWKVHTKVITFPLQSCRCRGSTPPEGRRRRCRTQSRTKVYIFAHRFNTRPPIRLMGWYQFKRRGNQTTVRKGKCGKGTYEPAYVERDVRARYVKRDVWAHLCKKGHMSPLMLKGTYEPVYVKRDLWARLCEKGPMSPLMWKGTYEPVNEEGRMSPFM